MAVTRDNQTPVPSSGKQNDVDTSTREFRATGQGLKVTLPNFSATAAIANASLTVRDESDRPEGKIYLFVNRVRTGWKLSGTYGQAQKSRTFFPRNLTMDDLVIEGTMANQNEYDKLVVFVKDHMYKAINNTDAIYNQGEETAVQVPYLDFKLFHPYAGRTYNHIPGSKAARNIQMYIVVTSIGAGHERFKFAPAFTLQCKVLWDKGDPDRDQTIQTDLLEALDYQQVFGPLGHPAAQGPAIDLKLPVSTYTGANRGTTGAGTSGGGGGGDGGGCDRAAVFPGYRDDLYSSDTDYMNKNNPPPSGQGSNYGNGAAPVKYPAACQGGGDNRHDLSYTKQDGDAYVDSAGGRFDGVGRVK